jgi:microcompartment protein CcmL/EutN
MPDYAAIGMLEYTSISAGINAADTMVKAASIKPVFFKTICPGKFLAAVTGTVEDVTASVEAGRSVGSELVADWFVIANIHQDVVAALSGCSTLRERAALGVIETFSVASAIQAADAAAKTADIKLLDIRTALGLGGKGFVLLSGDVAAVDASVAAASEVVKSTGLLAGTTVLPRPAPELITQLV